MWRHSARGRHISLRGGRVASHKPCLACGRSEKRRGNARFCEECWLRQQPAHVQATEARHRLAMIPEPLRVRSASTSPPGRLWCRDCQSFILEQDFSSKSKLRCKACQSIKTRGNRLENQYSITQNEYDILYEAQGGRCYLCGRRSLRVPLAVDHDHKTGEVRGLLCPDPNFGCNLKILPRFDASDDPVQMALRLLQYLRDPPARRILNR